MYIGRRTQKDSHYQSLYLKEREEKTIKNMKRLLVVCIPLLAYFIYQDLWIIKQPIVAILRLYLIVPYAVLMFYLFVVKTKNRVVTEILQALFWFGYLIMAIAMLNLLITHNMVESFHFRQVTQVLIIGFFLSFVFLGISSRWIHVILGIPMIILTFIIFHNDILPSPDKVTLFSNFLFIVFIIIYRVKIDEETRFKEFMYKKVNEEKLEEIQVLNSRLEQTARYDELTGTITRNVGITMVEHELKQSVRYERDLSVIFVDLDGLKSVNDDQGHSAGDQFINEEIEKIKQRIRASDYIIRLGGDEFLVVLPSCNETDAIDIVESLQHDTVSDQLKPARFSAGVATYDSKNHSSADLLIKHADIKMYENKRERKKERITL